MVRSQCRSWWLQTQEGPAFPFESKGRKRLSSQLSSQAGGVFIQESRPFALFRPSADWMRLTHLGKGTCFAQSTDSNVNLNKKQPHRNTQNHVRSNVWAPRDPIKWTHKIDQQESFLISQQVQLFWRGAFYAVSILAGERRTCSRG